LTYDPAMPFLTNKPAGKPASAGQIAESTAGSAADYRYYQHAGVPFVGQRLPVVTPAEYDNTTVRLSKSGYGLFDVSQPDMRHFGRTLAEILTRAANQEFVLHSLTEYNNGVVGDRPEAPPALFVFVVWLERFDIGVGDVGKHVKPG